MLFGFSTFSLWTYNLSANEVKYKKIILIELFKYSANVRVNIEELVKLYQKTYI